MSDVTEAQIAWWFDRMDDLGRVLGKPGERDLVYEEIRRRATKPAAPSPAPVTDDDGCERELLIAEAWIDALKSQVAFCLEKFQEIEGCDVNATQDSLRQIARDSLRALDMSVANGAKPSPAPGEAIEALVDRLCLEVGDGVTVRRHPDGWSVRLEGGTWKHAKAPTLRAALAALAGKETT